MKCGQSPLATWEDRWQPGKTGDAGIDQERVRAYIPSHSTIVSIDEEKDSPTIGREGGVEDQSSICLLTTTTEMETTTSKAIEQSINVRTQLECEFCNRKFKNSKGLKTHQGKVCKKRTKQCTSSDYQTRSKSSREAHHSGMILAAAESPIASTDTEGGKLSWKKAEDGMASK